MPAITDFSNRSMVADASIASGQSLSSAIDIGGTTMLAIIMPSAWTAASITFQVSNDGSNFSDLYNSGGSEVSVTVAASKAIQLDALQFLGWRYIKLRSGTAAAAVNQAASRSLQLLVKPL